jgi:hypothetical protein
MQGVPPTTFVRKPPECVSSMPHTASQFVIQSRHSWARRELSGDKSGAWGVIPTRSFCFGALRLSSGSLSAVSTCKKELRAIAGKQLGAINDEIEVAARNRKTTVAKSVT